MLAQRDRHARPSQLCARRRNRRVRLAHIAARFQPVLAAIGNQLLAGGPDVQRALLQFGFVIQPRQIGIGVGDARRQSQPRLLRVQLRRAGL